nr:hypothetical protein [Tanacetum cinerariifolium]
MAAAGDLDEIEEVNANCILMANLQQASTSGTQHDRAPVYDTDGSAEVQLNDNCYDNKETLELAQESREKMRLLKKEIKPANYAKINHLLGVFVPQTTKSKEELFLSNVSNTVTIPKMISIPNEDLSDDTTPSVARKFLNEYTKCEECKYDKISYDKDYNDMQQKVEQLQAQLSDLKGLVHTARTRRPQPKGNTRNARIPSATKSSEVKKNVIVEECRRTLLLSKN